MDKVLKQRLVGATILIALAVIFVPMLFQEPGPTEGVQELSMDVPRPPPGRGEIRRLPLDPARVSAPGPEEPAELEEPLPTAPNPQPVSELPPEALAGMQTDPAPAPEPESSPPATEAEAADERDVAVDETSAPDQLPELEPAVPPPAAEAAGQATGDWIVQVASFGSIETADRIREQLEQLGHRADSELLVRGNTRLYRIWTGPYDERSAAERARSQIVATVGDVEPLVRSISDDDGESPVMSSDDPVFSVQVGSFAEQLNAERQSGELIEQGFEAFIHADTSGARPIWRVRVGRFPNREQASGFLERLRADAGLEGLIVTHP